MPAQKKRGRPSSSSAAAKKRAEAAKKKRSDRYQTAAFMLFGVGALMIALTLIQGNDVWNALRGAVFGVFGVPAYFVGPLLLAVAVMCTYEKQMSGAKLPLTLLVALTVCALFLVFSKNAVEGATVWEKVKYLYNAGVNASGGGALSAVLGLTLLTWCGKTAAGIVLIVMLFIFMLMLAGKTLVDVIEAIRSPVEKTRERIREERELLEEYPDEPKTAPVASIKAPTPPRPLRQTGTSPIDIPLGDESETVDVRLVRKRFGKKSRIDIPLDASKAPTAAGTPAEKNKIDIPLGPVSKPTEPVKESTAEFVKSTLEAADMSRVANDDIFAKFAGRKGIDPDTEELIQKVAKNVGQESSAPAVSDSGMTTASEYRFPPLSLLSNPKAQNDANITEELRANAEYLVNTLESFGVQTKVIDIARGPTVTRYELQPQRGVRISRIANLADDIALSLATAGVRIEAPIPNKAAVGIEVPNKKKQVVPLRAVLESAEFNGAKSALTVALGKDISGEIRITDIAKMPHLLIAGTTGSGKSKCLHAMIISMMYKSAPKDLRFVIIDPKMVEFGIYNGIPHMLIPVVTDARKAAGALGWAVGEMMKRYKLFSECAVRDIDAYNKMVDSGRQPDDPDAQPYVRLPRIVVVIDELADLMLVAPNEVEDAICRLAQMARAAGIHLIIATQRPSVDVITRIIKANIASRLALSVSSQVDSRTILDGSGAEKLLGYGDMLFRPMDLPKAVRIQGCLVTDDEVESIVKFVKKNAVAEYNEQVLAEIERQASKEKQKGGAAAPLDEGDGDAMLDAAIEVVVEAGQASTSLLQRKLKLGYSRAARIMDEMENMGVVGPPDGSKPRVVKLTMQQWNEMRNNRGL